MKTINYMIEIPKGDYERSHFAQLCERFNCKLLNGKRGDATFKIESVNPVNFFWLGCNLNFYYNNGIAISAASEIFNK